MQGFITPENRVFSNKYYQNILLGNAFFQSDRALGNSPLTRPCVEAYAADNDMFFRNFTCANPKKETCCCAHSIMKWVVPSLASTCEMGCCCLAYLLGTDCFLKCQASD